MTLWQRPLLALLAAPLACAAARDPQVTTCSVGDGAACEDGNFCWLGDGDQEGCAGDGTCAIPPEYCMELYDPVCGCDDRTYSTACHAAANRTNVAHKGGCDGSTCATDYPTCRDGSFCQLGAREGGGCAGDGTCAALPGACIQVYDPVCGCDGRTYPNSCYAEMSGTNTASRGDCPASDAVSEDARHYVACGKGSGCPEGNFRAADAAEGHKVRCCAAELQPWMQGWKKRSGCSVWAGSEVGGCHQMSLAAATERCVGAGGRLCTREELEGRCTKGSGCGFDRHLVWSSSPVPPGHYVVCGRGSGCPGEDVAVAPNDQPHEVRCCSEASLLGWTKRAGCNVWAESRLDGTCYHDKSHGEAQDICAGAGGRLCTKEELQEQCTRGTGCGHDWDLIWSSTVE